MKATNKAAQTIEAKAPKTVARSTYIQSIIITFLATAVLGLVGGYFASINVHSQARQSVIAEMQVASKANEQ